MTRRNLHIDRLASAWLIKQFILKPAVLGIIAAGIIKLGQAAIKSSTFC